MRPKRPFLLLLSACVTGGILGALANSAALWAAGKYGVLSWAAVSSLRPDWTWPWLRPRLLWGAIWGAGFAPVAHFARRRVVAGLLYSLVPSAVQLFYVFPTLQGKGLMGLSHGAMTPAVVLGANAVFGIAMALWVAVAAAEP